MQTPEIMSAAMDLVLAFRSKASCFIREPGDPAVSVSLNVTATLHVSMCFPVRSIAKGCMVLDIASSLDAGTRHSGQSVECIGLLLVYQ